MAARGWTAALLLLLPVLAGCLGGSEPTASVVVSNDTNTSGPVDPRLPDDRGESSGLKETNKTEPGVGGMHHQHDYWQGREQVVVVDRRVALSHLPLFPEGEGKPARSVAYVKLPNSSLVFEGTDRLTIQVDDPQLLEGGSVVPASLTFQYMTAADNAWRDGAALAWGEPHEMQVAPKETDMPHSSMSLWVFRLLTDKPTPLHSVQVTITIFKGRTIVEWPGHPDFYADTDHRVVLDTNVRTRVNGIATNILLYDDAGTWVHPEKLISWGTTHLFVYVNITGSSNALGAKPDSFHLEYHNATVIGAEINSGTSRHDPTPPEDLTSYDFVVNVSDYSMDGPYQPESRWGFRMRASFANGHLCPGCFDYDIEYDIKIVAVSAPPKEEDA